MTLSKQEAKQQLEKLIFDNELPQDWVQDFWGMSPTLGETAAKLLEVFEALIESCPDAKLDDLLQNLSEDSIE
ncbi:MAG: hypothetical protein QNJ68_11370 [Microcoleaceae cyanobacterium MO_207.B10]|nr:hypothetical protein [Microcoleaceae cyanobacterium MO_207.B10]